ncbi:phosphoribosylaminoimidazolesuccinocarboxamide synthase [Sulfurisphaera tokodaii]|uniref:Phosphoribosylaminoimidazole-succinocarboxamide synthase n=2 Tax=Sulfurisphaera tokodaii TaxID=111955 RepID=PUR7_SULTO|nr:phosphoribosylaminoimidazolesuccinocarboxamide synthase [Sulfurisphaera tokodaii]Q970V9.1 RecName: Full=Phosphoribosylaminoimidazole-succinocarboxamide synthase; AltName: Full=SAICAR synthetase [Sulfurisphaera tokodaii str. 7]BAB66564.1 phosphoribosylaminoimidazole-succinocarboxamide synthase [Sulfurisphaera tokodaii str. 7]HII73620.1 phosphoribosylaminoimidazolesuccinocarboxamide synthase [Sulfurisphaera tokodaii]
MEFLKLSEGKTKEVYAYDDSHVLLKFKDSITAGDGARKDILEGKGILNAQTSAFLFRLLESKGIETHYIGMFDERTMIAKKLKMIPVEVVLRNIATGSIVKRLPIKEGEVFEPPIIEFFLKDDERHDPMLNYYHMEYLKLMTRKEAEKIEEIMLKVNEILYPFFRSKKLLLYDFKLEFGRVNDKLIIGDELTLDSMRIREEGSGRILDKDLYRKGADLETVKKAYEEFFKRISE